MVSTKKKLSGLIVVAVLLLVALCFYRMGASWVKVRENCTQNIVGQSLSQLKETLSSGGAMMRCSSDENKCTFYSQAIGGPMCRITHSSERIILTHEYFPGDGEVVQ